MVFIRGNIVFFRGTHVFFSYNGKMVVLYEKNMMNRLTLLACFDGKTSFMSDVFELWFIKENWDFIRKAVGLTRFDQETCGL